MSRPLSQQGVELPAHRSARTRAAFPAFDLHADALARDAHDAHDAQDTRAAPAAATLDLWAAANAGLDVCDCSQSRRNDRAVADLTTAARDRKWLRRAAPWLLPLLLLLAWEGASRSGALATRILPEPLSVARAAWRLWQDGSLLTDVAASTGRALSGFAIGATLGLLLGVATGLSRWLEALLDSTLQMIRNIPALATIPLVILWFGIDESAKLFLVALGVFFPIYVNTYHGIRSVDGDLIEMARSYDLRGWRLCREVVIPGALPSVLVGVRFALGLMWVMLIVAETISAQSGIGFMTMNARVFMQTDVVLVGILLYALLGKLADLAAKALAFVLLPWQRSRRFGLPS